MFKSVGQCPPLAKACIPLLEACTKASHLAQILALVITKGLSQDRQTSNAILHIGHKLLRSHSRARNPGTVLSLYRRLIQCGASPNGVTFSLVLKACSDLKSLGFILGIHARCLALGFQSDALVLDSLIHAYVTCGSMKFAHQIFDEFPDRDQIAWTELMNGYVRSGRSEVAVDLFFSMIGANVRPDGFSIVAVTNACSQLGDLSLAKMVEGFACKLGVEHNIHVGNSLIDMYGKCGSIDDSWRLFNGMLDKDVVSWNSMIARLARSGDMEAAKRLFDQMTNKNQVSWSLLVNGFVQNECFKEALKLYDEMTDAGVASNDAAITGAVAACAHIGALDFGRRIHLHLDDSKLCYDMVLSTALVDMYAKCGCIDLACSLFDRIVHKSGVTWNVMIMGLATHGKAAECFNLFSRMLEDGMKPSSISFVGILSACAHAGLLQEGKDYYEQMTKIYRITPRAEHLSCMVCLLGRAGLISEAFHLVCATPLEPDIATWGALLSCCNVHGYVDLGGFVAEKMLELDPTHTAAYVQLSSMYASANKWRQVQEIRKRMKEGGAQNRIGWSWFELDGIIHEFIVGVNSHPSVKDIHGVLRSIYLHMNERIICQQVFGRDSEIVSSI